MIQRELEALVASTSPGDPPGAGDTEPTRPRVLRFEVAPDTFATFREAMRQLEPLAGGRLDDDALLLAMARHVLGGPNDTGRSSYQISLDVCSACGRGAQLAGGERVPVDAAVVAMATCDAQHLGEVLAAIAAPSADEETPRGASEGARESTSAASATACQCSDRAHVGMDHLHLGGASYQPAHDELLVERQRDGTITFRRADGSPYGDPAAPRAIDAHTKVFSALRHLGFREGERWLGHRGYRMDLALRQLRRHHRRSRPHRAQRRLARERSVVRAASQPARLAKSGPFAC